MPMEHLNLPCVVGFADCSETHPFATMRDALDYIMVETDGPQRVKAWVRCEGRQLELSEIVVLAASLGLEWHA